jgi:hypothetical protein
MKQSIFSTAFAIFGTVASVNLKQLPSAQGGLVALGSGEKSGAAPELKPIPGSAVAVQSLQPLSSLPASKNAASFLPPQATAAPAKQQFSTIQAAPNALLGASAAPAAANPGVFSTQLQGFKTIMIGQGPDASTTAAAAIASQAPPLVSAAPAAPAASARPAVSPAAPRLSAAPAASSAAPLASLAAIAASSSAATAAAAPLVSLAPIAASSAAAALKPLPGSAAPVGAVSSLAPLLPISAGTELARATTTARAGLNATAASGVAQGTGVFNSVSPPSSSPAIVRSVAAAGLHLPLASLAGLVGLATLVLL